MFSRRLIIGICRDFFYSCIFFKRFKRYFEIVGANPPKKVIYTTISDNYDCLNLHVYLNPEYRYVCFTDSRWYLRRKTVGPWEIRPLPFTKRDNIRNSRYAKMHPHELFPDYEESIFVDANVVFKSNKIFAAAEALSAQKDVFLAIPPHRRRDCIYDELDACLFHQRDKEDVLLRHKAFLEEEGFPRHWGLTENNVIYRKHHHPLCVKLMSEWWNMLENYSRRDQLSLFYVLWKNNQKMTYLLDKAIKADKQNFRLYHHNRHARRKK